MSREEAIERLKNYTQYKCGGVDLVAINMAIQALEQELCNDTVSRGVFEQVMWERDTAIEQLRELGYELGQKIEPCDDCVSRSAVLDLMQIKMGGKELYKAIYELPPVTPKREQGEWIEHPHECGENWEFSKYECSICHTWEENDSDFCPNCGAEMVIKSCSTCKHDGELVCATHGCNNKERYEVKT